MPEPALPKPAENSLPINRRSFIKASAVGVTAIAGTAQLQGCATTRLELPKNSRFQYLREKDIAILTALTPAILPAEFSGTKEANQKKLNHFLPQIDDFIVHTSNFTQFAIHDLFDKLYFAPTRILLTGMWTSWEKATPEQIDEFLIGWRDSYFNLFRGGYGQLTQLVSVVWYSQPENWPATHYPGPPKHIVS